MKSHTEEERVASKPKLRPSELPRGSKVHQYQITSRQIGIMGSKQHIQLCALQRNTVRSTSMYFSKTYGRSE